jgi:acetolactate synthase I/II/III large subunit
VKITIAQAIVRCLELEGIEYAFGITGSHYLSFFNALKDSTIKYISVKHEGAAGFMALNYTKTSQKPALMLGTAGPGAVNLVSGIAELYKSGIPGIVITPLVSSNLFGRNAYQEDSGYGVSYSINHLFSCITKKSLLAYKPDRIPEYLRELFRNSLSAPYGPVHLGVPSDFFSIEIEYENIEPYQYRLVNDKRVENEKIEQLNSFLKEAKNPVICIGSRCVYPNCSSALQSVVDIIQSPFIVTHGSKGILNEYQELFAGVVDYYGHRSAEKLIRQSDMVLAIGMDFSEAETLAYDPDLFKNTKILSIDSDILRFAMSYPIELAIAGDIAATLNALCAFLKQHEYLPTRSVKAIADDIISTNISQNDLMAQEAMPLKIEYIYAEISKLLPQNAIVFADTGASSFSSVRHLKIRQNGYFTSAAGYPMGQSVAGCIGGKCAYIDKFILCLSGDGSFLMHGNEVLTAVQYKLGITWMIFIDDYYNMIQINQCLSYGGGLEFCTKIQNPDYKYLAQAFGVYFYEVRSPSDLKTSILESIKDNKNNESSIITVYYDYEQHLPVKSQMVQTMKEMGQMKDIKSNQYLMKAFAKTLKEKI